MWWRFWNLPFIIFVRVDLKNLSLYVGWQFFLFPHENCASRQKYALRPFSWVFWFSRPLFPKISRPFYDFSPVLKIENESMIISQNIMTVDAVYSYNWLQGNFLVWATWFCFLLKKDSVRETLWFVRTCSGILKWKKLRRK